MQFDVMAPYENTSVAPSVGMTSSFCSGQLKAGNYLLPMGVDRYRIHGENNIWLSFLLLAHF